MRDERAALPSRSGRPDGCRAPFHQPVRRKRRRWADEGRAFPGDLAASRCRRIVVTPWGLLTHPPCVVVHARSPARTPRGPDIRDAERQGTRQPRERDHAQDEPRATMPGHRRVHPRTSTVISRSGARLARPLRPFTSRICDVSPSRFSALQQGCPPEVENTAVPGPPSVVPTPAMVLPKPDLCQDILSIWGTPVGASVPLSRQPRRGTKRPTRVA
jgi:hypothetical protein